MPELQDSYLDRAGLFKESLAVIQALSGGKPRTRRSHTSTGMEQQYV